MKRYKLIFKTHARARKVFTWIFYAVDNYSARSYARRHILSEYGEQAVIEFIFREKSRRSVQNEQTIIG